MTIRARLAELFHPVRDTEDRSVLSVERSAAGKRWVDRLDGPASERALAIAQRNGVPDILARVLAGRGVTAESAPAYLDPTVKALMPEPYTLTDMERAANRIARAIRDRERVMLIGDYDVDGAVSAALMARFLRHFGLAPIVYIPDRLFEGYGPNPESVRRLSKAGGGLLVTLDCGTTSHAALDEAAALGIETIVVDHHQTDERLPHALAVVNPNRHDDLSGQGSLSAAGVVFLVLVAVNRLLRKDEAHGHRGEPPLLEWLELVALSTVCDVVPLVGLNRAYVVKGLAGLGRRRLAGLRALQDVVRLQGPPTCHHLGYLLGPRINAGGRIGDATLGARLLITDDEDEARSIAVALDRYNTERRTIEGFMLDQALAEAERSLAGWADRPVILVASEGWHPGIVGLIASRLKERYGRPAFALAVGEGGLATGSGRSVPGVDLGAAVRAAVAAGLIVKGGGHAMAAGLTVARDCIAALEEFLHERLSDAVSTARSSETLALDGVLTAAGATAELVEQVERAGPFGSGNPPPCFVFPAHRVYYAETVSGGEHVRARLAGPDGALVEAIAFRSATGPIGNALLRGRGAMLHVAGRLQLDHWNGGARVKLNVEDTAASDNAAIA